MALAKLTTLFDYQEKTIEQLKSHYEGNRGVIVALGPGLGKTLISLLTARWITVKEMLYGEHPLPIIVISEVSPLQDWILACSKHFDPPLKVDCLGSKAKRGEAAIFKSWHVLQKADVVIASYEMLVQFHSRARLMSSPPTLTGATNGMDILYSTQCWPVVIFDEVHITRNETTRAHAAVKDVKSRYKIGLSASPCNNSASDVIAIHRAMNTCTSELGSSDEMIDKEYQRACQRSIIGGTMSSARQHYIPTDIVIRSDFLTEDERRDYDKIDDAHVLTKIVRERQFCSGAGGSTSRTKLLMLRDYIGQVVIPRREKIVVLCEFRDSVFMLSDELTTFFSKNLRVYQADGHTTQGERERIRGQFKNCFGSAILISTSIFEQGVNLEEANHIVRFDKWWNPVPEEQGRSRIERPGQKRSVFSILLLIENTIEDGIWILAQKKRELIDRILRGEYILTDSPSSSSSSTSSSSNENEEEEEEDEEDNQKKIIESHTLIGKLSRAAVELTCDLYIEDTKDLGTIVPATLPLTRHISFNQQDERDALEKRYPRRSWHVKVEDMKTRPSRPVSILKKMTKRNRQYNRRHFNNDENNSVEDIAPITILSSRKRRVRDEKK